MAMKDKAFLRISKQSSGDKEDDRQAVTNDPDTPTKRVRVDPLQFTSIQYPLYRPLAKLHSFIPTRPPQREGLCPKAKDWVEARVQYDSKAGRVKYVHQPQNHQQLNEVGNVIALNAAFDAYKDHLSTLEAGDFEFVSVLAESTPEKVRAWFREKQKECRQQGIMKQLREEARKEQKRTISRQLQYQQQRQQQQKGQMKRHDKRFQQQGKRQEHTTEEDEEEDAEEYEDEDEEEDEEFKRDEVSRKGSGYRQKRKHKNDSDFQDDDDDDDDDEFHIRSEHRRKPKQPKIPQRRALHQPLLQARSTKTTADESTTRARPEVKLIYGQVLQTTSCRSKVLDSRTLRCWECGHGRVGNCSFRDFRIMGLSSGEVKDNDPNDLQYEFFSDPSPDVLLDLELAGLSMSSASYILAHVGVCGLQFLERDVQVTYRNSQGLYRRQFPNQLQCNICKSMMICGYQMCKICGISLCFECEQKHSNLIKCRLGEQHDRSLFLTCVAFHESTAKILLMRLEQALHLLPTDMKMLGRRMTDITAKQENRRVQRVIVHKGYGSKPVKVSRIKVTMSTSRFQELWSQGYILVCYIYIEKTEWEPKSLLKAMDERELNVYDQCSKAVLQTRPLSVVLKRLVSRSEFEGAWIVEPLRNAVPELLAELMLQLPVQSYVQPMGQYNLARYLTPESKRTEPESKIYLCQRVTAEWDIFRAEERKLVELFLNERYGEKQPIKESFDPFIERSPYLDKDALKALYKDTGVKPRRVSLKEHGTIMIPAGCLHQARCLTGMILVSVTFVSPERLWATLDWYRDLKPQMINYMSDKGGLSELGLAPKVAVMSALAMMTFQSQSPS
ncbi:hypothetical protein BGZ94_009508 [Podila epigama]|nr:hypothetical protein BGZ94_009508 [Podila epigama]